MASATNGMKVKYAPEGTAGVRPTTGYVELEDAVKIPAFSNAPNNIDVTPLSATTTKSYVPGLSDPGGSKGIVFNLTNEFETAWGTFVTAANTADTAGKKMWIEITHPALTNSFYVPVMPSPLAIDEAASDGANQITAYVTQTGEYIRAAKSTT